MLSSAELITRLQDEQLLPSGTIEETANLISDLEVDSLGLMLIVVTLEDLGDFANYPPEILRHLVTVDDLHTFYVNGVNNHRQKNLGVKGDANSEHH
jgi:acyl carrier protein